MEKLSEIKRAVFKVGTDLVTNENGLDVDFIADIAGQCYRIIKNEGMQIVIASSGAIASGRHRIPSLGDSIADKRTAAMYGQHIMADGWVKAFDGFKIAVATPVYKDEELPNARQPLLRALEEGVVVANGNDAAYDSQTEIQIISADNDKLAGYLATTIDAQLLVLLTDIKDGKDGVLDEHEQVIRRFRYDGEVRILQAGKSLNGTGGMKSKIQVAREFASLGNIAVIANGRIPNVLLRILEGEDIGTWIV